MRNVGVGTCGSEGPEEARGYLVADRDNGWCE